MTVDHIAISRCPRCAAEAHVTQHVDGLCYGPALGVDEQHPEGEAYAVICSAVLCRMIGPRRMLRSAAIEVWNART